MMQLTDSEPQIGSKTTQDQGRPSARERAPEIVKLTFDHPSNDDVAYQLRRRAITDAVREYRDGEVVPRIDYLDEEHQVWRTVREQIEVQHSLFACRRYRDAWVDLSLDRDHVPQLADVNAALAPRTGFRMSPVTGFVSPRAFMGQLASGVFLSTQYVRYARTPLFSPDPDVIHEIIGHAPTLLDPAFAELNRQFGRAALRVDDDALEAVTRMHWFTLETGLAKEDGALKVYGAAILSSPAEMGHSLVRSTLRPFNIDEICDTTFEPTVLQDRLFVVESVDAMIRTVGAWLDAL